MTDVQMRVDADHELVSPDGRWRWDSQGWQPAEAVQPPAELRPERPVARPTALVLSPPVVSNQDDPSADLDSMLAGPSRTPPRHGLRGVVHRLSGGAIHVGPSRHELERLRVAELIRTPLLDQPHLIAVGTEKGGVGKTTISILLGAALALERHHPVLYLEANPHHGTSGARLKLHHERSIADFVEQLRRHGEPSSDIEVALPTIHRYTSLVDELGLEAMTAPLDPGQRMVLGADEYRRAFSVLYRHFPILCLDQGTGTHDSGTEWVWRACDQSVVVTPATLDGAKLADHTLDFLAARRRPDLDAVGDDQGRSGRTWLKQRAVVVLNRVGEGGRAERRELDVLHRHFGRRARAVCLVRFDRHLAAGRWIELDRLGPGVRDDLRRLAAEVGSGFALGFSSDAVEVSGRG